MKDSINILQLTLHEQLVGYLVGFQGGRNAFYFADEFKFNNQRPTFSLTTHPSFPLSAKLMAEPWRRNQRLHPILSNLLPEGALRELIAQSLKVHPDNEFKILSYLGEDLPGAIVATPMNSANAPASLLSTISIGSGGQVSLVDFDDDFYQIRGSNKFSLAGVQMKFSMKEMDGRYNLATTGKLGNWIVKTPSTKHKDVPLNEYTAMTLASLVGVDIPDIKLVEVAQLDDLPPINLPDEKYAFAIKRFDRKLELQENKVVRVHMEDFAQVLVKYPHEKYSSANYEQIGRVIYQFSAEGLADIQQFARRLLVNILLANGDAHLKNWSLLYQDKIAPRLSPAYDILTTQVYITGERHIALNLAKTKDWYQVSYASFQLWAEKVGVPWRAIKPHLDDVMDKARTLWLPALNNLPMNEVHKKKLAEHWLNLSADFKISKS